MKEFLNEIKNRVYICGDIGSTHGGKLEYALEAVEKAKDIGLDSLKFQLGVSKPNIDLKFDDFLKAFELGKQIGIDVTASIFDPLLLTDYLSLEPKFIKYAYSQKDHHSQQTALEYNIPIVVSCDVMTWDEPVSESIKLFCLPYYPVYYEIAFESIFKRPMFNRNEVEVIPPLFYGVSDHSLSIYQAESAVEAGAWWIEKHISLCKKGIQCPDSLFALSFRECWHMVKNIRDLKVMRQQ